MRYLISLTLSVYLAFQPAFATLNEVDKTNIFSKNMLKNGGFENGKASWTASAGTFAVTTSSPMVGLQHATWDAAASGNTLTSGDITIPAGFFARNGAASCVFTTASGTATHEIQVYDGANILSETTITSSTTPTRTSTNFIFPSSASVSVRIFANADEPSISLDDCYLGPAEGYNVSNVSQAKFAGESYFLGTSACAWSRTSATIGAFTADTDCPGPTVVRSTVGSWQTTDVNLPEQTINNLPPGIYIATFYVNQQSGVVSNIALAINDGTTTCKATAVSTATTPTGSVVSCTFEYTSAGNRSFELYGASASSTITINGDVTSPQQHTRFMLEYFPTTQETAYTADVTNWRVDANLSGSTNFALGSSNQTAYIGMTNSGITLTNNATATATAQVPCATTTAPSGTTCTAADESNGVAFTIPRAGTYEACVEFTHQAAGSGSPVVATTFQIVETPTNAQTISQEGKSRVSSGIGTASNMFFPHNLCGTFKFDSVGQKVLRLMYEQSITATVATNEIIADGNTSLGQRDVHWTVKAVDQSFPAPNLVNSVVSNNSGIRKQIHAELDCEAGSSIFNQTGSTSNGVSSIGNISAGACVVNFAAGTFSAAPYCQATAIIGDGAGDVLDIGFTASPTTSSVTVDCHINSSTDCTSYTFHLFCDGAK